MSIGRINRTKGIALAAITSTAVAAGVILIQGAANADPAPTMSEAKKQVADLQHQAEVAGESANALRGQISAAQARVNALKSGIAKQQAQVDAVKRQIGSLAVAGYQTSGISTTAQLLLSTNPDQFLSQASTAQAFAGQQNAALRRYQLAQGKLTDLQASEQTELGALQAVQAKQTGFVNQLNSNLDKAQGVLDKLSAADRKRIEQENARAAENARKQRPTRSGDRTSTDTNIPNIPASGRGAIAINAALSQLGDPYVWGAAGPSSYDCSGLTMYAWGKAGVSLSHSAAAQSGEGRPISRSELQPGDLVFYYTPISHVALYLGNGRIVHAPRPGKSVEIAPMNEMPIAAMVRPG
ncbi:C40 family peptidase [Kribbella sp.]|uniref:C40 family peptidase n=1 Tax=Kribbella sp. TaxID=1871183 RepID=UPI002D4E670D|nr:NlpC/P60 family protein [Kribbella sp.]HZX07837.1 NlpC/P60 family protein [Kribbella sp.]